jgi:hypothetical protein
MIRSIVAAFACMFAANANAGDALAGTLTQPTFMPDGVVLVHSSGARTGAPSCVSDIHRFALDATTPQGKVQLAGLLAAYSAGRQVRIVGTGSSTNCTYGEWISYFYIVE